jgi:hypothetical protein
MHDELFDSTIPAGEPELLKTSTYTRYLEELDRHPALSHMSTRLALLSPSLLADLQRFEQGEKSSETLEVIAACIRHSSQVTISLACADRVLPLTVFPREQLVHCPMNMDELIERHLPHLRVMHLEPAVLRPLGSPENELVSAPQLYHPISPLLWALALRGPRHELLPEIAGPAVYRLAPGFDGAGLDLGDNIRTLLVRMRTRVVPLSELASWPGLDREHAIRLLNALYLQAGLIVSRSHPEAVRESWFGGL